MKKTIGFILSMVLVSTLAVAQDDDAIQKPTFAVHFIMNDFKGAANVRANSLGVVFKNRQFGKIKDMAPGLAFNYISGLTKTFDFSATLAGSFVDYPIPNKQAFGRDFLLMEADASIRGKLISNKALVNPYLQLGMGISKYKSYVGAFLPVGAGLQVNLFNEAYLIVNAQYRVPITDNTQYHFFYSIGLAGNLSKKKSD
jgi:OmpA-OmpF porin, OOP family